MVADRDAPGVDPSARHANPVKTIFIACAPVSFSEENRVEETTGRSTEYTYLLTREDCHASRSQS